MLYVNELKEILNNSKQFIKSTNYYFQNHDCKVLNKNVRVEMKYNIIVDDCEKILRIGKCEHCNNAYYMESFEKARIL